jgi:hypothetical protein
VGEESSQVDYDTVELNIISKMARHIPRDYAFINSSSSPEARENVNWYNVLYIVEKAGIAERKGFGLVYTDVTRFSPGSPWEWKEIVLG